VEKICEWRVTVVDDEVFPARIVTTDVARDDWRRHQLDPGSVKFELGDFPSSASEMCQEYLRRVGLRFGAFDFAEDANGKLVFLECNSNGQFGWLEDELGFPMSRAIAVALMHNCAY
jgi:glutathione synthase/RimK-type ligase-like ATP-grasp enzyme